MIDNIEINDIKAETLISQMDLKKDLSVQAEGVFSRNYSEDLIKTVFDIDQTIVSISRDGLFHILPNGLFFKEDQMREDMKKGNDFHSAHEKLKQKKKEVQSFFRPFDTAFFNLLLDLEHKLNELSIRGNSVFNPSGSAPHSNEYITKLSILLPFASQIRGNNLLINDLLRNVFDVKKVEIKKVTPFHIQFNIIKEGLNKEEYLAMDSELKSFFDFFAHWFLPVEMKYDFKIKDYSNTFTLGAPLILDYNTHL